MRITYTVSSLEGLLLMSMPEGVASYACLLWG